ncbi:hypothetical protein Tco_1095962, partial [Tanacetum coccineum]
ITEYLVNISKRCAFRSLNKDILKITILTTNMPYPSRKIQRIRACTHQRPDIKRGPYSKKLQYAVSNPLDTPYRTGFQTVYIENSKMSFKCAKSYSRYLNHKSRFSEEKKSRRGLATHSNP